MEQRIKLHTNIAMLIILIAFMLLVSVRPYSITLPRSNYLTSYQSRV